MFKYLLPLIVFSIMAVFLALGLQLNPREIPSPFIDKPAPQFSLPQLHDPQKQLTTAQMQGQVWLLNVWASWCFSCRQEHPLFNKLAQQTSAPIIGLNYKDAEQDAKLWLQKLGDPYRISIADLEGRAGLDWGVYGVPETFVMDKRNIVRYKHTGPLTTDDMQEIIMPLIAKLQAEEIKPPG